MVKAGLPNFLSKVQLVSVFIGVWLMKTMVLCVAAAVTTTPVLAQKGEPTGRARMAGASTESLLQRDGPEGQTLDMVQVPAGFGDGRITERDARSLASYCIWGFNQLLQMEGIQMTLGTDAESRMLEFWVYVWDHVDDETKAIISMADVIWPIVRHKWETGTDQEKMMLVTQFAGVAEEVWGGIEQQTVLYLAGQMLPTQYAQVVDQAIQASYASSGGGSGSGGFTGSVDDLVNHTPTYSDEYVMNDGSGDIMYSDPS